MNHDFSSETCDSILLALVRAMAAHAVLFRDHHDLEDEQLHLAMLYEFIASAPHGQFGFRQTGLGHEDSASLA